MEEEVRDSPAPPVNRISQVIDGTSENEKDQETKSSSLKFIVHSAKTRVSVAARGVIIESG